jgi:FO synthase
LCGKSSIENRPTKSGAHLRRTNQPDLESILLINLLSRKTASRYARKMFSPITCLCRDTCGYCTLSRHRPAALDRPSYLAKKQSRLRGQDARRLPRALFTQGDKPELRYGVARPRSLVIRQPSNMLRIAALVLRETGLLPTSTLAS